MTRLVRIYGKEVEPSEVDVIKFTPAKHHKKAIGLLFSADCLISLSFQNNTDLKLNQIQYSYKDEGLASPSKRIIPLNETMDNCHTQGTIRNLKKAHNKAEKRMIDAFLVVEYER